MLTQNDIKLLKELFIPQFRALDGNIDTLNIKLTGKLDVLEDDITVMKKEIGKLKNSVKQIKKVSKK